MSAGDGAHVLRLREAEKQIDDDHGDLFERLNDHRDATEIVAIARAML